MICNPCNIKLGPEGTLQLAVECRCHWGLGQVQPALGDAKDCHELINNASKPVYKSQSCLGRG
jgi:hypothetical protein